MAGVVLLVWKAAAMTPAEADEALAEAIRQHAEAYEISEPDELLADFAVIATWLPPSNDDGLSRYTTHYHRPNVPEHVAVGLFSIGVELAADNSGDS